MNFVVSIIALTGLLCCVSVAEGYNYTSLGCFNDKKRPVRALASLEGTSELLDGRFKRRQNATAKCAEVAYSLNFTIFAVARGGECLGDGQSNDTFSMYGLSDNCQADGEGGRRPPAMEVYEITADVCQELEVDCYGDCCNQTWSETETEMRCSGYWDWNTGCKLSPDYCTPIQRDNSQYAKSLGAPETCYNNCHYQCNYPEEMNCYGNWDGCEYSYCYYVGNTNSTGYGSAVRAASGNDTCFPTCPTMCSQYDLVCSNGYDANGCSYGEHCIPLATDNWDGSECPGVCYTPCDYNAGEVYCPIESQDGCNAGNYCEMPDADGNACQGAAMRFDPEDELMLRSGSPDSVAAFYKKLTDMARK